MNDTIVLRCPKSQCEPLLFPGPKTNEPSSSLSHQLAYSRVELNLLCAVITAVFCFSTSSRCGASYIQCRVRSLCAHRRFVELNDGGTGPEHSHNGIFLPLTNTVEE
ncbi:hypothetical protein K474DRAFT_897433 [Panus rudis PR-1116 ss-1]|nr:hypothetical protein K474DRAFT_897433 [Panus rudis PR-1116 ss-1]